MEQMPQVQVKFPSEGGQAAVLSAAVVRVAEKTSQVPGGSPTDINRNGDKTKQPAHR